MKKFCISRNFDVCEFSEGLNRSFLSRNEFASEESRGFSSERILGELLQEARKAFLWMVWSIKCCYAF